MKQAVLLEVTITEKEKIKKHTKSPPPTPSSANVVCCTPVV